MTTPLRYRAGWLLVAVLALIMPIEAAYGATPRILFGMGPTIDSARFEKLVTDAPVNMLSVWYNGPNDLGWITDDYHRSMYRSVYADGKAIHLIVFAGGPEVRFDTKDGPVCGRRYPLRYRFAEDMRALATAFKNSGAPRLYVTLFTEFQTYPCEDNAYSPNAQTSRYYRLLKERYTRAAAIFHRVAPNAAVSIGWGGWQLRWDDPSIDGGRSMVDRFGTLMRNSDFVSFQSMSGDDNMGDIRRMTARLGNYGPVMLAHYKPGGANASDLFDAEMRRLLTEDRLAALRRDGLFAIGFMDHELLSARADTYRFVRDRVRQFGASAAQGDPFD